MRMMLRSVVFNACALDRWAAASGLAPFDTRADNIARVMKAEHVDFMFVQELVTYENARRLSREMGWGGKIVGDDTGEDNPKVGDSCVLHGDGGVATGLIWNPKKIRAISTGQFITYIGRKRRNFKETHGRFDMGVKFGASVSHYEFEPKGRNYAGHWGNRERYLQADAQIDNTYKPGQTWIYGVDANGDFDEAEDGFRKALHGHNMLDTTESAIKEMRATRYEIMRAGHTRDVKVPVQRTLYMNDVLDHHAILIDMEIPR